MRKYKTEEERLQARRESKKRWNEKHQEYYKQYAAENAEEIKQYKKQWNKEHPKAYIKRARRKNFRVNYDIYTFKAEDDRGYYKNGEYHLGYKNNKGYIIDNIGTECGICYPFLEHIIKWEFFNGEIPEGMEIDHIIPVRNGGTNKLDNLRLVTRKENANNPMSIINKSESHKGNTHSEETKNKMSESHKCKSQR